MMVISRRNGETEAQEGNTDQLSPVVVGFSTSFFVGNFLLRLPISPPDSILPTNLLLLPLPCASSTFLCCVRVFLWNYGVLLPNFLIYILINLIALLFPFLLSLASSLDERTRPRNGRSSRRRNCCARTTRRSIRIININRVARNPNLRPLRWASLTEMATEEAAAETDVLGRQALGQPPTPRIR